MVHEVTPEEIERMLQERVWEQKEEYNGGSHWVGTSDLARFRSLKNHFTHTVWLNPSHRTDYWHVSETYSVLKEEFDMYYLTVDNLVKAMKKLISAR